MAENETGTPAGDDGIPKHTPGGKGELSPRDAANALTDWQNKQHAAASEPKKPAVSQPVSAPEAPAADESADEVDAAPKGPGEDDLETDPAQQPSIEPPDRWTQDAKSHWQSIPRETQEYIQQRELERDRLLLQSKNEADEQLKGLTAREQAMEQARLQFEAATQASLQSLQSQLQGEFSDIQTMEDVKKLAAEDWARYLRWDAHQKDIAAKMTAVREAQTRQADEEKSKFAKFADEQDKHFIERVPDFADKEKAARLQNAAIETLKKVGFSEDELTRYWNGQEKFSFRDARQQELIHKAARWDEAQAAKKTISAKPLPPVQRPGVAQPSNSTENQIKDLIKQSKQSTGHAQAQIEARILTLRQQSARRSG